MNCPRCQKELNSLTLEASELKVCPNCEGTWYPGEALAEVTDHSLKELVQSDLKPNMVGDQLAKVDLDKAIDCPECGKEMIRYKYTLTCPIELDECEQHGIWLDDGELGSLMQYLTDLDKRVGALTERTLSERNLATLQELSRSPAAYSLPGNLLATINMVYSRER